MREAYLFLVFSKKQLLALVIFSILFLFPILLISVLDFFSHTSFVFNLLLFFLLTILLHFIIFKDTDLFLKSVLGMPGWLSRLSIRFLISTQVVVSQLWDRAPNQALHWAWSLLEILSLSHSAPLLHFFARPLSLSLSNKIKN